MRYSLDTNACIALINGNAPNVRKRFDLAVAVSGPIFLSSIVFFELWYGVQNSTKITENILRLERFVAGKFQLLPFETRDAQVAGKLRSDLNAIGRPIGPYDLLIAAQSMARGMTLVTHNTREFGRISGLAIEDWQA